MHGDDQLSPRVDVLHPHQVGASTSDVLHCVICHGHSELGLIDLQLTRVLVIAGMLHDEQLDLIGGHQAQLARELA